MNSVLELQGHIKNHIKEILIDYGYVGEDFEVVLEEPSNKENGDYSTNCAMQLAKVARKAPRKIAEEIVEKFNKENYFVYNIDIAGPGFINFYLNQTILTTIIKEVLNNEKTYGRSFFGKGEKINIEFVSANPTGDLHLGHARGAAIGDTLSRILDAAGYDVTREYYINDAGKQIHNLALSTIARYLQQLGKEAEMPEDGYHGQDIIDIANNLVRQFGEKYIEESEERYDLFKNYALTYELEKIKHDLAKFAVHFDVWSSEQALYEQNKIPLAIEKLENKGYLYEEDGALWFKSTAFKDDKDRVLRKSDGSLTYFTPDIAYHIDKLERGFSKLINVLGADHHGYVPRLKSAIECLTGDSEKLEVTIIQMVRLMKNGKEYKMSKRSGNALTIRDIVEEVGTDAVRYFFAMRSSDSQMDFDVDLATKKSNENPVYYAQYAHARISSILSQAKEQGLTVTSKDQYSLITSDKAYDVLKKVAEFPRVVQDSACKRLPHRITNYINELASLFHSFYNAEKVIDLEQVEKSEELLALIKSTQITIKNSLALIGVSAPYKM
ncbi:arginine--tRNA ligase [Haloplasma contractile]|uniref:Arginine--tRNA ligase n=1 Tax=Haloplasma contractile SSD-17B TaxID=1033810 RepID=F7PT30_9MOLU|nr:arginine--tRNA ligase [Haloplasma contractile]ERJ12558.1 Arginine--tRNA ligase protein [Haloplasma contractile SSD-17B]